MTPDNSEFSTSMDGHFSHKGFDVNLYGRRRDAQFTGYLLVGAAVDKQSKRLALSRAKS